MQRDILNRYAPYRFEKEYEYEDDGTRGRLIGVKAIFHKSFLRDRREEERRQAERQVG